MTDEYGTIALSLRDLWAWVRPDSDEVALSTARILRWELRSAYVAAGGKTLTITALAAVIKRTEQLAAKAEPFRGAALMTMLEDMRREHAWRESLCDQVTQWPDHSDWMP